MKNIHWVFALLLLFFHSAIAQNSGGFKGGVTPSRFDLRVDAGEIVRESVSIYNLSDKPLLFEVQTNDWLFSEVGKISFSDELLDNSCREWVRLERRQMKILPSAYRARSFRFEVHVPENTPAQECRFALMVNNVGNEYTPEIGKGVSLPAVGRVAIIVYLAIGDAKSDTSIIDFSTVARNYLTLPIVQVKNNGNAHDRLDAELVATDNSGKDFRLSVSSSPILPGQTRNLLMQPQDEFAKKAIDYPIAIKGRIFTKDNTFAIDRVINN